MAQEMAQKKKKIQKKKKKKKTQIQTACFGHFFESHVFEPLITYEVNLFFPSNLSYVKLLIKTAKVC